MAHQFPKLRQQTPWLQAYSSPLVRHALYYLAQAYKQFFAQGGFPQFKSRYHTRDGFTIPYEVKCNQGKLYVPKVGWLPTKGDNPYGEHAVRQARIKKEGTENRPKWYVYLVYQVPVQAVKPPALEGALGLDRNVRQCTDSDGLLYTMADTALLDTKIKRKQREKARSQTGSNRSKRKGWQVRKLHRKKKRIRDNDTHHISRALADKSHTVVIEDLPVKGMTQSAQGTVDHPGKNVKQKAGLNREILATSWNKLEQRLEYKCGRLIKVNPVYTSQTCSSCGYISPDNRKTQAVFECQACGIKLHADHNAAINILVRYLRTVARGTGATARREAFPLGTLMTREQDILAESSI